LKAVAPLGLQVRILSLPPFLQIYPSFNSSFRRKPESPEPLRLSQNVIVQVVMRVRLSPE
jgi:hypothetical protein